eukprot:11533434-Heterocapsa_arctica.AAC.1
MDMTRSCPDVLACAEELGWSRGTLSRPNAAARLEDQVVALLASTAPGRPSPRGNVTWEQPQLPPPGHGDVAA